jgi:Domain of unknown function (DUF4410)
MLTRKLLVLALAIVTIAPLAQARGGKAPTQPGTYKAWGPDIDEIEIVKPFKAGDYTTIAILPFDTSKTPLPDASEKSYNSVKTVVEGYTETLAEALRDALQGKKKVEIVKSAPKSGGTLILRGSVLEVEPGSRAKRYLGGFGAGSAANKMTGELVDAKTGEVLVRFTQARRSGGTFKVAGGNDVQVMRDSIHATGQDVAHILEQF